MMFGHVETVEERIELLNSYHTLAVYRDACRGIFERHKPLLSLHISAKVLASMDDLNAAEYSIFLKGGIGLDRSTQATNPASDWISTQMWDNITELEHLEKGPQED